MAQNRRVINATLLVGAFFALDKVVALGRQFLIARAYGVGAELDAYNAANNLPDTLYTLIAGGALTVALIPVLAQAREQGGRTALWELFSLIANLAFVVTAALAAGIALFAGPLVQAVIVPKFSPEQQALVASLMRLNLLATLLFALSSLITGGLQANQHFLLPALAPLLYNVGQVVGVLALGPTQRLAAAWGHVPALGPALTTLTALHPDLGIYGFAYGTILGAGLHLAIQIPGLARQGFRWTPRLTLAPPAVRQVLRLMGPRVLTLGCISAIFIINDNLASGFSAGAISALAFGWVIQQIPETLIGTAVGTALLPTLGELVAQGQTEAVRRLLRRALGAMLALTVPITGIAWLILPWATRLVFAERADLVTQAARLFMLGLAGHSLKEVAARAFYAYQDARTPLFTAALNLILFVAAGLALLPGLGFAALALANSLSFSVETGLLLVLLFRRGRL